MLGRCGVRLGYCGLENKREGELVNAGTFSFKSKADCTLRQIHYIGISEGISGRHEPQFRRPNSYRV